MNCPTCAKPMTRRLYERHYECECGAIFIPAQGVGQSLGNKNFPAREGLGGNAAGFSIPGHLSRPSGNPIEAAHFNFLKKEGNEAGGSSWLSIRPSRNLIKAAFFFNQATPRLTGRYEVPRTEGLEDRVSLLEFVREACNGWSLERQIELGLQARRYSKAMGLVFTVEHLPGLGRVFTFPRCVLEEVRSKYAQTATLLDGDAAELERLLEAVWLHEGDASYEPEMLRGVAKTMKLMPAIFGVNTSLASERSAFGKLIARYDGRIFPSGFCVTHRRGRYHIKQTKAGVRTVAEALPRQRDRELACTSVN